MEKAMKAISEILSILETIVVYQRIDVTMTQSSTSPVIQPHGPITFVQKTTVGNITTITGSVPLFFNGQSDSDFTRVRLQFFVPDDNGNPFPLNGAVPASVVVFPATVSALGEQNFGWGVDDFFIVQLENFGQVNADIAVFGQKANLLRVGFQAIFIRP